MQLRSGYVLGQGQLSAEAKPIFDEALGIVFHRWTALCLAVENEWGGSSSRVKADELMEDVLQWFHRQRDHFVDDLEVLLTESMEYDFNTCAEDGSCHEVAKALVTIYDELLRGPASATLEQLKATAPTGASRSQAQPGPDGDMGEASSSSDDDEDGDDDDMMDAEGAGAAAGAYREAAERPAPAVDEDGFTMVPSRRRGR